MRQSGVSTRCMKKTAVLLPFNQSFFGFEAHESHLVYLTRDESGQQVMLQALSPATGAPLWDTVLEDELDLIWPQVEIGGPYLAMNKTAVYLSYANQMLAFALAGGRRLFTMEETTNEITWGMETQDDQLFQSRSRMLHAFDAQSGAESWFIEPSCAGEDDDSSFRNFDTDKEAIYVICSDGITGWQGLIAYDRQSRQEQWRAGLANDSGILMSRVPAVGETAVFSFGGSGFGTAKNKAVYALDKATGIELWQFRTTLVRSPVAEGGLVYVVDAAPRRRNWLTQITPAWH